MQSRQLFHVFLKVVGLFILIWAFSHLFQLLWIFYASLLEHDIPADMQFSVRFSLFIQTLSPALLFAIGIYLLKGGSAVTNSVFPERDDQESGSVPKAVFTMTIKILGLILLVYAFPKSLEILSHIAYLNTVSPAISTSDNVEHIARHLLPTLTYLGFGVYMLKGGRRLYIWAFSTDK